MNWFRLVWQFKPSRGIFYPLDWPCLTSHPTFLIVQDSAGIVYPEGRPRIRLGFLEVLDDPLFFELNGFCQDRLCLRGSLRIPDELLGDP